jgi:hypothetical protein
MSSSQLSSRKYYAADLDAPSTANLLTPSNQQSVQAALLQGPKMIRSTFSSTSLVGLFSFSLSRLPLASPIIRMSPLIHQLQLAGPPCYPQYPTR